MNNEAMSNQATPVPTPAGGQELREGVGVAVAFVVLFVFHVLVLQPPLSSTALLAYAVLTLALAALYVVSGLLRITQQAVQVGTLSLLPVFLLGSGLILAIALVLWGWTQLYFYLFVFNSYAAFVHYTGKRRWAVSFTVGMGAFAWLSYAVLEGWQAAGPALLDDLPWYGLTVAFSEIVARQREHRERVEALAAELAAAHRQLQDYTAQVEALAVAQERNRLAREIHDTVGHTLTALDVQLELLSRLPPGQTAQRRQVAEQARALVKEGLTGARRAVQALRPAALEVFSLPEAIAGLVAGFEQTAQIRAVWQVAGEVLPLPPRLAIPLYRAAQEALTNARRHAPTAQRVALRLRYEPEAVTLSVENDGVQTSEVFSDLGGLDGHGLRGLRERAESLGGAFSAGPDAAGGFRLEMRLPIMEYATRFPNPQLTP